MYQEQVRGNKNNRNNKGVKYNNHYNTNNANNNSNTNNNNNTNTNNANNKKINKRNILNHTIIKQELEEIKDKGLEVYINGDPYDIDKINEICLVLEENYYMKDYISNYDGKIVEVHYDKII